MSERESREDPGAPRCRACESPLYLRLSRDDLGALVRETYCARCDALPETLDVTATAGRRAARLAAAAREIAQGAA